MNFFDQWAGQAWTQGIPQTGPGGGIGAGSLLQNGKDDNSLGEHDAGLGGHHHVGDRNKPAGHRRYRDYPSTPRTSRQQMPLV